MWRTASIIGIRIAMQCMFVYVCREKNTLPTQLDENNHEFIIKLLMYFIDVKDWAKKERSSRWKLKVRHSEIMR